MDDDKKKKPDVAKKDDGEGKESKPSKLPFNKKKENGKSSTDKEKDAKKPPFGKKSDDSGSDDKDTGGKDDKADGKKPPFGKKSDDKGDGADRTKEVDGKKPVKKPVVKGPEITDKVKVDFEPEITKEDLEYIFDGDLSDINEHQDLLEELKAELTEVLSVAGRMKRRSSMRRQRHRLRQRRTRQLAHRANDKQITNRARHSAIELMKSRISGKRHWDSLPFSERSRIERIAHRRKGAITRMTRRLKRTKRDIDAKRLMKHHG